MGRKAEELLDNPQIPEIGEMPDFVDDTPYEKGLEMLSVLNGPQLQIMTRTNPRIIEASSVAYNLVSEFHTEYLAGFNDQNMRFAVSLKGQGRKEVVDITKGARNLKSQDSRRNSKTYRDAVPDED